MLSAVDRQPTRGAADSTLEAERHEPGCRTDRAFRNLVIRRSIERAGDFLFREHDSPLIAESSIVKADHHRRPSKDDAARAATQDRVVHASEGPHARRHDGIRQEAEVIDEVQACHFGPPANSHNRRRARDTSIQRARENASEPCPN